MLVVADQRAVRVGRQGGLAGAGQTKEQGDVFFARGGISAEIRGAVHRQHVFFRQQEVLHREHGFLHLTGIAHTGQEYPTLGEVQQHGAVGVGAVPGRVADEVRGADDLPDVLVLWVEALRIDEQHAAEQRVPGVLGGDLHGQVVGGIGANVQLPYKGVLIREVCLDPVEQRIEHCGRDGAVDDAPVDAGGTSRLLDDVAVHWRTARALAGAHDQRAIRGERSLVAKDGLFSQQSRREILEALFSGGRVDVYSHGRRGASGRGKLEGGH